MWHRNIGLMVGIIGLVVSCGGGDDDRSELLDGGSTGQPDSGLDRDDAEAAILDTAMDLAGVDNAITGDAASPPDPTCAQDPLPLTRFAEALRTTPSGRTFTGWGGASAPGVAQRHPVILIPGNGGTAEEWKPFRDYFCDAGYGDLEIWAITFQDYSCVGTCSSGSNEEHAEELEQLVSLVRDQTQAERVSIVAVSMGVVTARYYMKFGGGLDRDEVSVAYLVSGPNHGLPDCESYIAATINVACAELYTPSGWLDALNNPDETPNGQGDGMPPSKAVVYRTVSFTGDPFYSGSEWVSSPLLDGADNLVLPGNDHAVINITDMLSYLDKATP